MIYVLLYSIPLAGITVASYAPNVVDCPAGIQLARPPQGLAKQELQWVRGRKKVAANSFASFLRRVDLEDFDIATYESSVLNDPVSYMPTIAFANSGGGWRAAYTGAGAMRAFDETFAPSVQYKTGGLLQSMTYYAGLSGGSWPVSSYAFHNFAPMDDVVKTWNTEVDQGSFENFTKFFQEIAPKYEAGYNISVMDVLARSFAYQFLPGADGGLETTWSSIADLSNFKNFSGPMPLLQTSSIECGDPSAYGVFEPRFTNRMYEWTPFEFGSWDSGFTPTAYVGSLPHQNGFATKCVVGLDRASFVMGTAAAAWNYWWLSVSSNGTLGQFSKRDPIGPEVFPDRHQLARRDSPFGMNVFQGVHSAFNETFGLSIPQIANPSIPAAFSPLENLTLTDNSEALQSLPLRSLIQPERKSDFIVAWDDDADEAPYKWNNGSNLYFTSVWANQAGLPFPTVPPPSTFLARNYTLRPTFFGCNTSLTTTGDDRSPIVLYMTNAPYSWYSNFTWGDPFMSRATFEGVLINSFDIVTQGNGTLDAEWPSCVACAAIDRSLARVGMRRSDQCEKCFTKYCWDGSVESEDLSAVSSKGKTFDPSLILNSSYTFELWNKTHPVL
ncbi:lysophospholipase [Boeremia exigua]|uniref:lysophospholipase n=1 Tax=Boeremia exigua TaxID=749465 RepID=UPI001E8CD678|nr:lysophospholipase [Boeremia exigua]KAH6644279.1 lysophospholipase [Boeremia exigua]